MQEEEKTIGEMAAADAKGKGKKTFEVTISFLGEYIIDVEAADYRDAASFLEGETKNETEETLEEAIRLNIGKAAKNARLDISIPDIVSIVCTD